MGYRRLVLVMCGTPLAAGALLAQPTFPVTSAGEGSHAGLYHSRWQTSARGALSGDTLHVRHVIQNVSDSTISVNVLPCGVRLHGDLELRHLRGPEMCDPEVQTLAPGDSVWAESAYEIMSGPGQYQLTLRHASPARFGGAPDSNGFSFAVWTAEEAGRFGGVSRSGPFPLPALYYVVEFSGDESSQVDDDDVAQVVATVARQRAYTAIQVGRVAAERMLPSPYLLVRFRAGERGRFEQALRWVWTAEAGADTTPGMCDGIGSGAVRSRVGLGAMLAMEVDQMLERHRTGVCPPGD